MGKRGCCFSGLQHTRELPREVALDEVADGTGKSCLKLCERIERQRLHTGAISCREGGERAVLLHEWQDTEQV